MLKAISSLYDNLDGMCIDRDTFVIRLGYLMLEIQEKSKSIPKQFEDPIWDNYRTEIIDFISSNLKKSQNKLEIRFISNRQDLIESMKIRNLGLESFTIDRLDMYWITLTRLGREYKFYVVPDHGENFDIILSHYTYSKEEHECTLDIIDIARNMFVQTEEYNKMKEWTRNLKEAGYFENSRGLDETYRCKHCRCLFRKGTTHEHINYDNRPVYHNGKMYAEILKRGLDASWRPGFRADEPSLEEQGIIKEPCDPNA